MHLQKLYTLIFTLSCLITTLVAQAQNTASSPQLRSSSMADTWPATDALGRQLPLATRQGIIRKDRYVGMFYFVWHGAHGYDHNMPVRSDEGVQEKQPGDTLSPYNITEILAA